MNRKVLGRGLEALISDSSINDSGQGQALEIPLEKIDVNPEQPRLDFSGEKIEELADSIKSKGVIQPVIVRKSSGSVNFQLVAGERRLRAALIAGIKNIPARVMNIEDEELLEIALIENIQRRNLNPIEEANGYYKLMNKYSHTQEKLAERLGVNRISLANTTRLLNLNTEIQQMIIDGELSAGHGKVLLSLPEKDRLNSGDAGNSAQTNRFFPDKVQS